MFAPYHGWVIRKAVAAGMYALPTKAQLLNKLNEDGEINSVLVLFFSFKDFVQSSKLVFLFASCDNEVFLFILVDLIML